MLAGRRNRPAAELAIPIRAADSDGEGERLRRRRNKRKSRCCGGECNAQTPMTACMMLAVTGIFVMLLVIAVSVYGPYGRVNQTLLTVETMVAQVNSSGVTNVVFDMAQNWITSNSTAATFHLLQDAFASFEIVSGIVLAIEPQVVLELANKTSITVTGLLQLIDGIIVNQGLDISIPLRRIA